MAVQTGAIFAVYYNIISKASTFTKKVVIHCHAWMFGVLMTPVCLSKRIGYSKKKTNLSSPSSRLLEIIAPIIYRKRVMDLSDAMLIKNY